MSSKKKKDYYKLKTRSNFSNNDYIEYESNDDRNVNLSQDKYFNKIESYSRDIIIDLQNSDTWKIQLTSAINFFSSRDAEECNASKHVVHSNSESIKFRTNLETSMRGSELNSEFIYQLK